MFGGPVVHIGYFRQGFVVRQRLSEKAFAELVAGAASGVARAVIA